MQRFFNCAKQKFKFTQISKKNSILHEISVQKISNPNFARMCQRAINFLQLASLLRISWIKFWCHAKNAIFLATSALGHLCNVSNAFFSDRRNVIVFVVSPSCQERPLLLPSAVAADLSIKTLSKQLHLQTTRRATIKKVFLLRSEWLFFVSNEHGAGCGEAEALFFDKAITIGDLFLKMWNEGRALMGFWRIFVKKLCFGDIKKILRGIFKEVLRNLGKRH